MVNDAETGARNAEADKTNDPGYCQQQTRMWSGIPSRYPDASTAWRNTNDRYPGNRNPPRGAHVFWTGGSHGYGHVAMSLGGGKVRSTDAGGAGKVATVDLGWVESAWGLPYAGWACTYPPHPDVRTECSPDPTHPQGRVPCPPGGAGGRGTPGGYLGGRCFGLSFQRIQSSS